MSRIPPGAFARASLQLPRAATVRQPALRSQVLLSSRRWASSSAPKIRYGLRGGLLRWGIAAGGVYWYATQGSRLLADEPAYVSPRLPHTEHEDENLVTVDEIYATRKARKTQASTSSPEASPNVATPGQTAGGLAGGVGDLEEEAEGEGAFNPETGEINWDCPCLGGMAHGPCGPEFREAFSCFVFSKEDPKGMDCVDRFKGMQDCFRLHPEIYGEELEGDDEGEEQAGEATPAAGTTAQAAEPSTPAATTKSSDAGPAPPHVSAVTAPIPSRDEMLQGRDKERARPAQGQPKGNGSQSAKEEILDETEQLVPRYWHDETGANEKSGKSEKK